LPFVTSLAKGSEVSPNFYIGITGGLIEAELRPSDTTEVDPNFGYWAPQAKTTGPASALYSTTNLQPTVMETGDGKASRYNTRNIRLPPMVENDELLSRFDVALEMRRQHRLDYGFQRLKDF